jgi:hypothetical protein
LNRIAECATTQGGADTWESRSRERMGMARDCAVCRLGRVVAGALATGCFLALAGLSLSAGGEVPGWIWAGAGLSAGFLTWAWRTRAGSDATGEAAAEAPRRQGVD